MDKSYDDRVFEAAEAFVLRYGREAFFRAISIAERSREAGDGEGTKMWRDIARAIEAISNESPTTIN